MVGCPPVLWIHDGGSIVGCDQGFISLWNQNGQPLQKLSHDCVGLVDVTVSLTLITAHVPLYHLRRIFITSRPLPQDPLVCEEKHGT